jgi:diguanylate cyclase (GGDEF)-like protein
MGENTHNGASAHSRPSRREKLARRPLDATLKGALGPATDASQQTLPELDKLKRALATGLQQSKGAQRQVKMLADRNARLQQDLIELAQKETQARQLAYHDGLTGLPNRSLLIDRLQQAMSQAARQNKQVALLLLDLDEFKTVNDKLGHAAGDQLLQAVAERLTACIRGADTVCRYGGDEFVIMLPEIDGPDTAATVVTKIRDHLGAPYLIDGHKIHATASIGIAFYPEDGLTCNDLMKQADVAMYRAKTRILAAPCQSRLDLKTRNQAALNGANPLGKQGLSLHPDAAQVKGIAGFACAKPSHVEAPLHASEERERVPVGDKDGVHSPLFDGRRAILSLSNDVTARKHAETSLLAQEQALRTVAEAAARAAETANHAKDEFLVTLAHELRAPLAAILGWTQVLQAGNAQAALQVRALAAIERSARAQTKLVDDLWNIAEIGAGKLRLDVQAMRLIVAIEAAIESARPALDAKQVTVQPTLDRRADAISGDPGRLQQIVGNLLSNAIKFTPRGGRIDVTLTRVGSQAEIAIADDGEGISADFLPYVFERFTQGDTSSKKKHGGLGLGLAIVRHLVELHGGQIEAYSAGKGRGSRFTVWLPIDRGADAAADDTPDQSSVLGAPLRGQRRRVTGFRILSVEDDCNAQEMMQAALELAGAKVLSVSSVRDALDKIKTWRPHVLVSDIGLAEEDGIDLIRKVRKLPTERGGSTPAIALTGYSRDRDQSVALDAGFQAFLAKPFHLAELVSMIATVAGSSVQPYSPGSTV